MSLISDRIITVVIFRIDSHELHRVCASLELIISAVKAEFLQ